MFPARTIIACVLALLGPSLAASMAPVPFRYIEVDHDGPGSCWGKGVGDLNGDGRADLIVGGTEKRGLYWYANPDWTKKTIDPAASVSTDIEVADLNRDGKNDLVVVTSRPGYLLWYEQSGADWTKHTIAEDTLHDIEVGDLDADGLLDVVGRNQGAPGGDVLYFYKQRAPESWTRTTLKTAGGEGLKLADLNRDGRPDVIINGSWYENTGDLGSWNKHTYSRSWTWPHTYIATGEINGDGRLDIALAPSEAAGQIDHISWFEAPADPTGEWVEHVVEARAECVHHFIGVADFNRDGRADLATAMMQQGKEPRITIYLNDGGGRSWTKQIVADTSSHSMKVIDIDNDGTPSLFGANWNDRPSTIIKLWKNTAAPVKRD
jgi:FG-GAP-like repeat